MTHPQLAQVRPPYGYGPPQTSRRWQDALLALLALSVVAVCAVALRAG